MKLVVASYVSERRSAKVMRLLIGDRLKKYGKVLECHNAKAWWRCGVHDDDKETGDSQRTKCERGQQRPCNGTEGRSEITSMLSSVEPVSQAKDQHFPGLRHNTRQRSDI